MSFCSVCIVLRCLCHGKFILCIFCGWLVNKRFTVLCILTINMLQLAQLETAVKCAFIMVISALKQSLDDYCMIVVCGFPYVWCMWCVSECICACMCLCVCG